jgi:hypothetical protein
VRPEGLGKLENSSFIHIVEAYRRHKRERERRREKRQAHTILVRKFQGILLILFSDEDIIKADVK